MLACSALRRRYRDALRAGQDGVQFVYLSGKKELVAARMGLRRDHYMPAALLDSQFASLEEPGPDEAITVSIGQPLDEVVAGVLEIVIPRLQA